MQEDLLRIGLAFLEGFALIISPCILPILPIMLSGSLTGNKSRPLGIICGFVLTFSLFTLFSRYIIQLLHLSPDALRNVSFVILIVLGVVMVSSYLTEKFNAATGHLLNTGNSLRMANDTQGGFFSGILFGGLVGIIWTPCAGPILAAVIVQVVTDQTTLGSIFTVIAFGIGAGVPMLIIAFAGRKIMNRFSWFREHTDLIRKALGVVIIASVIAMILIPTGYLGYAQTSGNRNSQGLVNGLEMPYAAPDFSGITAWINSPPLTIEGLKGKVVLIDFWTYSCINCIRTLPYLKDWYAKYHNKGFEIVGVHSPEFLFEHDLNNVKNAVAADGITYPVALDNNFGTWQNYKNEYWPAHYLINKDGEVVYVHFGEGEYDTTENNIRYLLNLKPAAVAGGEENYSAGTPETYLGYARAESFASPETVNDDKPALYTYPDQLSMNQWALSGTWTIYSDKIVAVIPGAAVKLHFTAKNVYAVMGAAKTITVKARLDGEELVQHEGKDVHEGKVSVVGDKLYSILSFGSESEGYLELTAEEAGLEVYTFTFG